MQQQGGPRKEFAEQQLEDLEQREKDQMDQARQQFGAEAVDLLGRHVEALQELEVEGMRAAFGDGRQPAGR